MSWICNCFCPSTPVQKFPPHRGTDRSADYNETRTNSSLANTGVVPPGKTTTAATTCAKTNKEWEKKRSLSAEGRMNGTFEKGVIKRDEPVSQKPTSLFQKTQSANAILCSNGILVKDIVLRCEERESVRMPRLLRKGEHASLKPLDSSREESVGRKDSLAVSQTKEALPLPNSISNQ
jgi:hypothetical protein